MQIEIVNCVKLVKLNSDFKHWWNEIRKLFHNISVMSSYLLSGTLLILRMQKYVKHELQESLNSRHLLRNECPLAHEFNRQQNIAFTYFSRTIMVLYIW